MVRWRAACRITQQSALATATPNTSRASAQGFTSRSVISTGQPAQQLGLAQIRSPQMLRSPGRPAAPHSRERLPGEIASETRIPHETSSTGDPDSRQPRSFRPPPTLGRMLPGCVRRATSAHDLLGKVLVPMTPPRHRHAHPAGSLSFSCV